jgi:molybdopterin molybdotransferase
MTDDPRMQGFKRRWEVAEVEKLLLERVKALPPEEAGSTAAAGRVLAEKVVAPMNVPPFDRAAMDGYAVKGEETFGAFEYAPIPFQVVGASMPGKAFEGSVGPGQAVKIMTGAPLPAGADAVLMAEDARAVGSDIIHAIGSVPPEKNVSRAGEDVKQGETVFDPGRVLRPQDIGVLASMGVARVKVCGRPRVDVLATGNELLPAGAKADGHRIVDSNTPMLHALVARDGGLVERHPIVKDDEDALRAAIDRCTGNAVLLAGGSSVGIEDLVPRVVATRGKLEVHGVAMRPSSPTGIGFIDGRPVFLLQGNPVSCLCAYDFFAGPSIRAMGGRAREWPYRTVSLPLAQKLASESGRLDYVRVRIAGGKVEPLMVAGASVLSSTTRADGFVIVPRDDEGFPEGATVTVHLYGS